MGDENPYKSQSSDSPHDGKSHAPGARRFGRVFTYSYCTSLVVAFTVVVIWLVVLFNSTYSAHRRTGPPDIVELLFLFVTTTPSILTCLCFSLCYCSIVQQPENPKIWPAILIGVLSGLIFNAMNAITLIEYFFDW